MTAIDVRDLAVSLAGRQVLSDVQLTIGAGELVSIIGPNGAGKTTLLRALLGLVPASGTISIVGQEPERAYRDIGYVPQRHEFAWDFPVSVTQAVMSGRTRHIGWFRSARRADHAAVARALRLAEISDLAHRTVSQLSGGQRQRVLIARALACDPKVLLLDEPFTGLDVPTQELLTSLYLDLVHEGVTIVMTTHDLAQAMVHSHRIVLVNRTIIADGPPAKLRDLGLWEQVFGLDADAAAFSGMALERAC